MGLNMNTVAVMRRFGCLGSVPADQEGAQMRQDHDSEDWEETANPAESTWQNQSD